MRTLILILFFSLNLFGAGTNRYTFVTGSIAAGASTNSDTAAIPSGTTVLVEKVGLASQINALTTSLTNNVPDTRSDTLQLLWGSGSTFTTVMIMALSGNTLEIPINQRFVGDGIKFFRLTRTNNSGAARVSAAWAVAYDVQ